MRDSSLSDLEHHLNELFEQGSPPFDFDLVRFDELMNAAPSEVLRLTRNKRQAVTRFLRDQIGAMPHSRFTKAGERPSWTLWSIRDHEKWEELGAAGRMDAYQVHAKLRLLD